MTTTGSNPLSSPTSSPQESTRLRPAKAKKSRPVLGAILLTIGAVVALAAIVLLARLILGLASIESATLARIAAENLNYRTGFGFVEREISFINAMLAVPACLMLVATALIIPGYLVRRGSITSGKTRFWAGGSEKATYRPLAFWAHALWCLLPLAAWVAIILVPLRSMADGAWPAELPEENMTAVWLGLGSYGALAAGLFGVMVTSLVKKAVYVRIITRSPNAVAGGGGQKAWRWVTFRWRFDLWIAGVGAAFLGAGVIALGFDDLPFYLSTLVIGVVLFIGGMLLSLNYWRAGEPLGAAESYS